MKKIYLPIIITVLMIIVYTVFVLISHRITLNKIKFVNNHPETTITQLIGIKEENVLNKEVIYLNNECIGFNAVIYNKYYVSVTNLGKAPDNFYLKESNQEVRFDNKTNFIRSNDSLEINLRHIDINNYPYLINNEIIFYSNNIKEINNDNFTEIIIESEDYLTPYDKYFVKANHFSIDLSKKDKINFYYSIFTSKASFSFIKNDENLFLILLYPLQNNEFKSLHDILSLNKIKNVYKN